ncbi:MAG: SURF1 family protein [Sphingomonadales bacterium]|nr:MAG: SURF1 family protein [Sphingomonadales bacterium]
MGRWLLIAFTLLAALSFTALGVWQMERLAWKLDLIARVDASIKAPPASDWQNFAEYRRVRLSGVFLYDQETLVKAVTERGEGYWVMTPLRTPQGLVLVNRGYVQTAKSPRWCGPETETSVTGLLRPTEAKGGFLRSNDPAADRWFSRDVAAIAHARKLGPVAPFFIDADATPNPGGYPVGGLTVIAFRNNHLVYALTWFVLAALSVAAAIFVLRQKRA